MFDIKFILSLILAGCACMPFSGCACEGKKPDNLLPDKDVVRVLIHAHLLDAKTDLFFGKEDSTEQFYRHFEHQIFEKTHVDRQRYEQTMAYYLNNPEAFYDIYEKVVDSLSVRTKNQEID